jgi:hypothetical protein
LQICELLINYGRETAAPGSGSEDNHIIIAMDRANILNKIEQLNTHPSTAVYSAMANLVHKLNSSGHHTEENLAQANYEVQQMVPDST